MLDVATNQPGDFRMELNDEVNRGQRREAN